MHDSPGRRVRWFQLRLRDLVWLTLVAALTIAWVQQRLALAEMTAEQVRLQAHNAQLTVVRNLLQEQVAELEGLLMPHPNAEVRALEPD